MRVLLVEDDPDYREELVEEVLAPLTPRVEVVEVGDLAAARAALAAAPFDLVLLDVMFPQDAAAAKAARIDARAGFQLLDHLEAEGLKTPVVVISGQDKEDAIRLLLEHRIADYVFKDASIREIRARLVRQVDAARKQRAREAAGSTTGCVFGESPEMAEVRDMAERAAPEAVTVLIRGESGTGKEVLADFLHHSSPRAGGPFVKVNCAALPKDLVESELFGHAKGAFTGAEVARPGRFELAHGGTLFLDEIGDLPPEVQVKLLRVLQERVVERLGDPKPIPVDVRILCATHRDLEEAVAEGSFREDLYYRIDVFSIRLPPLRRRKQDLPALVEAFRQGLCQEMVRQVKAVSPEAMEVLRDHAWPGNIRELRNVLQRAFILARGDTITPAELVGLGRGPARGDAFAVRTDLGYHEAKQEALDAFDRVYLREALDKHNGVVLRTAEAIGYNRRDLARRVKDLGL